MVMVIARVFGDGGGDRDKRDILVLARSWNWTNKSSIVTTAAVMYSYVQLHCMSVCVWMRLYAFVSQCVCVAVSVCTAAGTGVGAVLCIGLCACWRHPLTVCDWMCVASCTHKGSSSCEYGSACLRWVAISSRARLCVYTWNTHTSNRPLIEHIVGTITHTHTQRLVLPHARSVACC